MKKLDEIHFFILHNLRQKTPKGIHSIVLLSFLQSIGLFLFTQDIYDLEESNFVFGKFIKKLLLKSLMLSTLDAYDFFVIIIDAVILIFFFLFLFTYLIKIISEKNKCFEYIFRSIFPVYVIAINYSAQHVLEILSFGLVRMIYKFNKYQAEWEFKYIYFQRNVLFINVVGCLNILPIFIVLSSVFLYKTFTGFENKKPPLVSVIIQILFIILLPIHSNFCLLELENLLYNVKFYFCFVIISVILIDFFIMNWKEFFTLRDQFLINKVIYIFCAVSSIEELIVAVLCIKKRSEDIQFITQFESSLKLISEILLTLIILKVVYIYKRHKYSEMITNHLFDEVKEKKVDFLLYYIQLIYENKFEDIIDMLIDHQLNCQRKECICKKMQINKIKRNMLQRYLTLIGMNEITAKISQLNQSANISFLEKLCIIHINYLFLIDRKPLCALYYAKNYLLYGGGKFSFLTRMILREAQSEMIRVLNGHNVISKVFKLTKSQEKANESKKGKIQFQYVILSEEIKEFMKKNLVNLENIIRFRSFEIYSKNSSSKVESLFQYFKNFQKYTEEIEEGIQKLRNVTRIKDKNFHTDYSLYPAFQFVLFHYYNFMHRKSPVIEIKASFFQKEKHFFIPSIELINPMILTYNFKEDLYEIKYINYIILNRLKYKRDNLINRPFNVLLPLPLSKVHDNYLKILSLLDIKFNPNNKFYSKSLLDKNNIAHIVDGNYGLLPMLSGDLHLIFNLTFKKTISHSKTDIGYYFILNKSCEIITTSDYFTNFFFLTDKMIKTLKISFPKLFGLSKDIIKKNFKKIKEHKIKNNICISELSSALTLFSKEKNYLKFYKLSKYSSMGNLYIEEEILITKGLLLKAVKEIEKEITDLNLDYEYFTRIRCLKDRLESTMIKPFKAKVICKFIGNIQYIVAVMEEEYQLKNLKAIVRALKEKYRLHLNKEDNDSLKKMDTETAPRMSLFSSNLFPNGVNSAFSQGGGGEDYSPTKVNHNLQSNGQALSKFFFLSNNLINNLTHNSEFNNTKNNSYLSSGERTAKSLLSQKTESSFRRSEKKKPSNKLFIHKVSTLPTEYQLKKFSQKMCFLSKTTGYYIMLVLVLLIYGMNIYNLVTNILTLKRSTICSYINLNAILLKGDIFDAFNFLFTSCLIFDGLSSNESSIKRAGTKADLLLSHFTSLNSRLSIINRHIDLTQLYATLHQQNNFTYIDDEGKSIIKYSTLNEEILQIYYYLKTFYYLKDESQCYIADILNKVETNHQHTSNEKLFKYFFYNTIQRFSVILEELANQSSSILFDYHNRAKYVILLTNSLILVSLLLFYSFLITSVTQSKINIKNLLIAFYVKNDNDKDVQGLVNKIIFSLKDMLDNYSYEMFHNYEELMNNAFSETEKRMKSVKSADDKKGKQDEYFYVNDNMSTMIKNKKVTEPLKVTVSITILVIIFTILVVYQVLMMLYITIAFDNLIKVNHATINFVERVPKLTELIQYYATSILMRDPFYITVDPNNYEKDLISNVYNVKYEIEKDTFLAPLGTSEFVSIFYQLKIIRKNIEIFSNQKKYKRQFKRLFYWQTNFNANEKFLIFVSLGQMRYIEREVCEENIIACFEKIASYTHGFLEKEKGLNIKGMDLVIDITLQEISALFVDFTTKWKENRNGNFIPFLSNEKLNMLMLNQQDIFKRVQNIENAVLKEDIEVVYRKYRINITIMTIFAVVLNVVCIIISFLLLLNKVNSYVKLLLHTGRKVYSIITKITVCKKENN